MLVTPELVTRARARDEAALREMLRLLDPVVGAALKKAPRDAREEIRADAHAKIALNIHTLADPRRVGAWAKKIAVHAYVDRIRADERTNGRTSRPVDERRKLLRLFAAALRAICQALAIDDIRQFAIKMPTPEKLAEAHEAIRTLRDMGRDLQRKPPRKGRRAFLPSLDEGRCAVLESLFARRLVLSSHLNALRACVTLPAVRMRAEMAIGTFEVPARPDIARVFDEAIGWIKRRTPGLVAERGGGDRIDRHARAILREGGCSHLLIAKLSKPGSVFYLMTVPELAEDAEKIARVLGYRKAMPSTRKTTLNASRLAASRAAR